MYNLRDYQKEAVDASINYYLEGGRENIVVAMPTGTGKSLVIAELLRTLFAKWPFMRALMVTHVAELVEQNYEKMINHWPAAPVGIYNAALNKKETSKAIIFGTVQSMIKKANSFGHRDLIVIDEAHLVGKNENSQYINLIKAIKSINPNCIIIGLTATPYRMQMGMITDGPIFTKLRYDLTGVEPFNKLIEFGYISPLIPQPTETDLNVDGVKMQNGDFAGKQLQAAVDKDDITYAAMCEMCEKAYDRQSWLVFTAGVDHAESAALALRQMGIDAVTVHSKLNKTEKNKRIKDFKTGIVRCLVTNNMLTTGFDHPQIDCIGVLRPTMSPGLWVQILGRGTRPAEGKNNCLVLDFAKNTPRLGPINDPRIPSKPGKPTGDIPVKICPECNIYNHAGARFCGGGSSPEIAKSHGGCGFKFIFETKYYQTSGSDKLVIGNDEKPNKIKEYKVTHVWYAKHEKNGKATMQVLYACGSKSFKEWIPFEHYGNPRSIAETWWSMRHPTPPPTRVDSALALQGDLLMPKKIVVDESSKYPVIQRHIFGA